MTLRRVIRDILSDKRVHSIPSDISILKKKRETFTTPDVYNRNNGIPFEIHRRVDGNNNAIFSPLLKKPVIIKKF